MKEITVLAFGAAADALGKNSFLLNDVASSDALIAKLEADFPALKNIPYTLAVNKKVVTMPVAIDGNTTVALLPPFSGG